jgi:hypothetical protein
MAKKATPTRSVTFRCPEDHYRTLAAVAKAKGIDVSAVLNQTIADAIPGLEDWLTNRELGSAAGALMTDVLAQVVPQEHAATVGTILAQVLEVPEGRERDELTTRLVRDAAGGKNTMSLLLHSWICVGRAILHSVEQISKHNEGGASDDEGQGQEEGEGEAGQG